MIFIKLFLAHLIGDFLLQPDSWVAEKEQKKLKSNKLIFHALIHFGLMFLFLGSTTMIPLILVVTALHMVMDMIKLYFQKEETKRSWFFIDQVVHILILAVAALSVYSKDLIILKLNELIEGEPFWVIITAVVFLSFPSAIIIKMVISRWSPQERLEEGTNKGSSLASAGKIIGILERLFVFTLVFIGQWQAIGFLLAAKSVFRFGDLREMKDRKLTEYVLIGTLMSFGIASLVALIARYFLEVYYS